MPSVSGKQRRFMELVAHDPAAAKRVGVPQSVGRDFVQADMKHGKHGPQSTGAKGHNPGSALRAPDGRTMDSGLGTPGAGGGQMIASIAKRSTLRPRKTLMGHRRHEDSIALPAPAKDEISAPERPAGYVPGLDDDEGEDYHTVMGGLAKTLFHALHRR